MNSYIIGNIVRLSASFTDEDGVLANPATVSVKIKKPEKTIETFAAIAGDNKGEFYYDYTTTDLGDHQYVFTGTGTIDAVANGKFNVKSEWLFNHD